MIYSIRADQPSFKTVQFKPGFNVILAERTKESSNKDSRNGLGKSTLIEIIHFCLGGKKGETISKQQLDKWTFTLEIDLAGKKYAISRNTSDTNKIIIDGDCSQWTIKPVIDKKTGRKIISRNDWTKVLGTLVYDIQPIYDIKYHPTFRSLISYFVRKNGHSGAFLNPFQHYKSQKEWDMQVNNCYLLGLGWEYVTKWQLLKDREKILSQLKQEATAGLISDLMGNIGELEAAKISLQSQMQQEKEQLDSFKVHRQYHEIEESANILTEQIHEYINLNVNEKRILQNYEASIKEEKDAKPEQVARVYEEAGLIFNDNVSKKIDEVMEFHKRVVVNRKEFLNSEIEKIKQLITQRDQAIQALTEKRAELMQTLKTHGAIQEYTMLQTNHQNTVAQLKDITLRLGNLRKFEQGRSSIVVEQELLRQQANNDLNERKAQKEAAIISFNEFSQNLYEASGMLSINISKNGYKFNVDIKRSGSHGIGNMKIFCYDLTLAKLWAKKTKTPAFLVHDSIIFADVDERQKAKALQLAEAMSAKEGFQYICTMNSDSIPRNDLGKFDFDKFVVLTLTDAKKDGGLLGIRF